MSEQLPEGTIAMELVGVANEIFELESTVHHNNGTDWNWKSPEGYKPHLELFATVNDETDINLKTGKFVIEHFDFMIAESGFVFTQKISADGAPEMKDDIFLQDFLDTFRKFLNERSGLLLPS